MMAVFRTLSALRLSAIREETNRIGANFLRIDSQVGLIFSGLALKADDEESRKRITGIARRAHDTILRLKHKVELTRAEAIRLDRRMLRLKQELVSLGETF